MLLSWRNIVRLVLMGFHFLFTIIPLGLCYAQTGDLALVAVHVQSLIACLVYIPAAFVLAIIDSPSRFTQAGGEVGYLVVQQCLWLPSAGFGAYWGSSAINAAAHSKGIANTDTITAGYQAAAGFGFLQFFMCVGWMVWVIVAVHQIGDDVHETFKVPTHSVIDGLGAAPTRKGAKRSRPAGHGNGKGNGNGNSIGDVGREEEGSYEEKKGLRDYRQREYPYKGDNASVRSQQRSTAQGPAQGYGYPQGYTPVDSNHQGRRVSNAPSYVSHGQNDRYAPAQSTGSNQYQDPFHQQQQQQYQRPQYSHDRRGSGHHSTHGSISSVSPQPIYSQQQQHDHRSSSASLPHAASPATNNTQGQLAQPYSQSQVYDAQATPIAPQPQQHIQAQSVRSASQAPMPVAQQQHARQSTIEQPPQAYQSRASQRYLQQQQVQPQVPQGQPQQVELHRPSPPWEGTPASRRSSGESRRSIDLPRIQTNV